MKQDAAVVLVDARQGFVDTFSLVLQAHGRLQLAGAAPSVDAAVSRGLTRRADVIALGLDERNGIDDLERLSAASPDVGVVALVGPDAEPLLSDALLRGVRGWVLRRSGVKELLDALEEVASGDAHLPAEPVRSLVAAALARRPATASLRTDALTGREAAVLECLAAGMTRHDIGTALQLSDNTVRTYVRRILRKLHVHSAPAAVELAAGGRRG